MTAGDVVRIVHTSDVHMDVFADRRCLSLERVVDLALEHDAHLLIIAGDMFDRNRVRNDVVEFAVGQLNRFGRPAVILPGNHDCLVEDSVFNREAWDAAPHVRIFREPAGETFHFDHLDVAIWGRPLVDYGDDVSPIEGMPGRHEEAAWSLGVAHGYFREEEGRGWASYQIEPEHVAATNLDYLALGDSHGFKETAVSETKVVYSGSPSSGSHTVALVELHHRSREVRVNRVSTVGGALIV